MGQLPENKRGPITCLRYSRFPSVSAVVFNSGKIYIFKTRLIFLRSRDIVQPAVGYPASILLPAVTQLEDGLGGWRGFNSLPIRLASADNSENH